MIQYEVRRYSGEWDFQSELNAKVADGFVLDSWKVIEISTQYSNFCIIAVYKKERK